MTIWFWYQAVEHGQIDHLRVLRHFMETFSVRDFKGRLPMDIAKNTQVTSSPSWNLQQVGCIGCAADAFVTGLSSIMTGQKL